MTTHPLSITHQGQFPAVTVSFNLAPRASLGDRDREGRRGRARPALPAGDAGRLPGHRGRVSRSLTNEALLILAALVTVYIVLGVLYESFIHPDHDPLDAAVGRRRRAARADRCSARTSSVVAIIGIILLIGIVKKNGIMMVDFALEAEREHGKSPTDAIYEACLLRFRPIMMTTMAALLGGLPLALGTGPRLGAAPPARHRDGRRPAAEPGRSRSTRRR